MEKINIDNQYVNLKNSIVIEKKEMDIIREKLKLKEESLNKKVRDLLSLIELYDDKNIDSHIKKEKNSNEEVLKNEYMENVDEYNKINLCIINKCKIKKIINSFVSFFAEILLFIRNRRLFHE